MTSPLIAAADLAHLLATRPTDVRVIDCRFNLADPTAGQAAWREGHIPGALYAHLDHDLSGTKTGHNGRHPMPAIADLTATARGWGIGPGTRVIAYDASGGMFAARLWWMLRWLGHEAVQVLDGGWNAWQALSGAVSTDTPPAPALGDFVAAPQTGWLLDTADVEAALARPGTMLLLDARAPDRFRGENETLDPVGGHIPGALNRFFQLNLAPDGRFQPPEALRTAYLTLLDGRPLDTLVHQCGSGVTACHNALAMAHAGLPVMRLYGGSWSAWCADPARPVARG